MVNCWGVSKVQIIPPCDKVFAVKLSWKYFPWFQGHACRVNRSGCSRVYCVSLQTCPACALRLPWLQESTCAGHLCVVKGTLNNLLTMIARYLYDIFNTELTNWKKFLWESFTGTLTFWFKDFFQAVSYSGTARCRSHEVKGFIPKCDFSLK